MEFQNIPTYKVQSFEKLKLLFNTSSSVYLLGVFTGLRENFFGVLQKLWQRRWWFMEVYVKPMAITELPYTCFALLDGTFLLLHQLDVRKYGTGAST